MQARLEIKAQVEPDLYVLHPYIEYIRTIKYVCRTDVQDAIRD